MSKWPHSIARCLMRLSLEITDMNVNPMQKKVYTENPRDIQLVAAW